MISANCFALILPLVAAHPSWCHVNHGGGCTGKRHSFNFTAPRSTWSNRLDLWERVLRRADGLNLQGVRFVDWDSDGDLDMVVAEKGLDAKKSQLRILEQLANGSFMPHPSAAVDLDTFAVGDWNADGRMDVLVCHAQNGMVMVSRMELSPMSNPELILNTSRVIARTQISETRSRTACGFNMQAIDFDRDGDLDLIVGDSHPRYFERISSGQLIEHVSQNPFAAIIKDGSIRVERILDFDGDGRLDVLLRINHWCTGAGSGGFGCFADLSLVRQAADGTFVEPIENPFAGLQIQEQELYAEEIEIIDWNRDGLLDVFFLKLSGTLGSGYFYSPTYIEHVVSRSVLPHDQFNPFKHIDLKGQELHIADVNSDGHADVIIAASDCSGHSTNSICSADGSLRLYQSEAGRNLKQVPDAFQNVSETKFGPFRIVLVDWDQDGDSDLIVAAFDGRLHYHEMIEGSWQEESQTNVFGKVTFPTRVRREPYFNVTSQRIEQLERGVNQAQPVPVDWDQDGDYDLVLAPEGWYWERLADGSLLRHPLEQSPFRNVLGVGRFVDCDWDGDEDLVTQGMVACERSGGSLKCDADFLCFGMNLTDFKTEPRERVYSFDFAYLKGYLRPELVTAQYNNRQIGLWSAGFCAPPDACYKKGICRAGSEECACITGHELQDCSGCEPNFFSVLKDGGQMHDCAACPGANGEVCHSRGVCFDDFRAKDSADSWIAAFWAIGNGSCTCSEEHFGGVDEEGRRTCVEGICPAGTEEKNGQCHLCDPGYMSFEGGTCHACKPGTFSVPTRSNCERCPVGSIAEEAGSSACTECSAGKHESKRQFCSDCPPGTMSTAGKGSCTMCSAGYHAMTSGSSACEFCAAATFSEEGSSSCTSCSPGTVSEAKREACSPCKAGQITRDSLTCEPCPGGTYAPERSTICRACPNGQVSGAQSSSCQPCESMWFRVLPDDRRERCIVSDLDYVFALVSWMAVACFTLFCLVGCYSKLPLQDLSLQGDKLVATTSLPHFFLRWDWASPAVSFTSTGVPDLDSGATWKAKAQSRDELLLSAKSMDRPLDTSMGFLRMKFPVAFIVTGFLGLPLAFWNLLILGAGVKTMSQLLWPLVLVVCGVGVLVGALLFYAWHRHGLHTSLAKRRRQFLRDLPRPQPCARGPERSITAGKLHDFLQFFNAFIKERSMYYVCENMVKPLTAPFKVSFVELVGPVDIQWFISHSWQMPVRHFSDSIFKHAQSYQTSWRESAYWICTFSNSQWHVKEELGNGRWQESSFYLSLISPQCRGTAMIIDELVQPLQRIWCLFEVYQTICLSRHGQSQGLLLCTSTGVLQEGNAGTDVAVAVARKISSLDTRTAEASNEADRMMIHALIEQMPGGFDAMNAFVRETISDALKSSHLQYERAFVDLVQTLDSQPVQPAPSAPPLPTLLTTHVRHEPGKDKGSSGS